MDRLLLDATRGFSERMKRLAIFSPLFLLKTKRKPLETNLPIDWFQLGLLTLLFFFENMLHRQTRKGKADLAAFLYQLHPLKAELDQALFNEIAEEMIHSFRKPNGTLHEEEFYNWETGEVETCRYSILKTSDYNKEKNQQYYILDEAGLELIFATREYFSEFRISINQLLIRKQLEKGEFSSALHEINEMRISVEAIRDKIKRLGQDVSQNIISDETYSKYVETIRETHDRLTREDEEFRELYAFANETKQKQSLDVRTDEDERAYGQLIQILKELGDVHHMHQQLLFDAIRLKNKALEAAKQALYSVGVQSFHFDQEIVSRIVSSPLPPIATDGLMRPFLKVHQEQTWSLLSVFSPQRLQKAEQEEEQSAYPDLDEETIEQNIAIQRENFTMIMAKVLEIMGEATSIELREIVEQLPENFLHHRSFYDLWLLLHQRSPLQAEKDSSTTEELHVLDGVQALLDTDTLTITECGDLLHPTSRYKIQNMLIERRK